MQGIIRDQHLWRGEGGRERSNCLTSPTKPRGTPRDFPHISLIWLEPQRSHVPTALSAVGETRLFWAGRVCMARACAGHAWKGKWNRCQVTSKTDRERHWQHVHCGCSFLPSTGKGRVSQLKKPGLNSRYLIVYLLSRCHSNYGQQASASEAYEALVRHIHSEGLVCR